MFLGDDVSTRLFRNVLIGVAMCFGTQYLLLDRVLTGHLFSSIRPAGARPASGAEVGHPALARASHLAQARRKHLVFNQMHKMASRSVPSVLKTLWDLKLANRSVVIGENDKNPLQEGAVVIVHESKGLVPAMTSHHLGRHNSFVIGAIRNPCEWYVSVWKWDCQCWENHNKKTKPGSGEDRRAVFNQKCGEDWRDGANSPMYFRKYLVSGRMPHMSGIMYDKYVDEEWQHFKHGKRSRRTNQKLYWNCTGDSSLAVNCRPDWDRIEPVTSSSYAAVDCWVRLTSLNADLRICLERWAAGSGIDLPDTFQQEEAPLTHLIEGLPCSAYYTQELAEAIMEVDRPVFEKFGYTACCGAPGADL